MKTGVECEYFLITQDGSAIADAADHADKPCYDQSALMRRYDVIAEICDAMLALGWKPYQNDHEDANGQFEMNWEYDDALVTADRHVVLQVHGQVDRGEARPSRDIHAEAVSGTDRLGLPRACFAVAGANATCSPTMPASSGCPSSATSSSAASWSTRRHCVR